MTPEQIGLLGGILGSIGGILGGVFGTWCAVRNCAGPRERAYIVRVAVVGWLLVLGFVAALLLLPHPERMWLWLPYGILLSLGIVTVNRRQQQLRQEEAGRAP